MLLECEPPPGRLLQHSYVLRFAADLADLRAVQRLRFEVFNLELGEGLGCAYDLERDEDRFDAACHHLMVIEREGGAVVGTYRMQTADMARAGCGFYSATEFDMSALSPEVLAQGVEVGRACVAREHRTGRVIALLWQGLARYMSWERKRYLFGCSSVPARSRAVGHRLYQQLSTNHALMASEHRVRPRAELDCAGAAVDDVEAPALPPLFEGYIRLGAQVCGPPAIDPEFGTVDFFVMLDLHRLDPRARRFFRASGWDDVASRVAERSSQ